MKIVKRIAVVLLIVIFILLLPALLVRFVFFHSMPDNAKIREITIDTYGLKYFVTETNELYIGGDHGDQYGVYNTGAYWGFLYGTRRLFCRSDAPVRFAENVTEVFPCTDGFLFTDTAMTLFYFGERTGGTVTEIASNVQTASGNGNSVVYATSDGNAFIRTCNDSIWSEAKQIATDVAQIYSNGFLARILNKDGAFYQIKLDDEKVTAIFPTEGAYFEEDIRSMSNSYNRTALITNSGDLICYDWESGQENNVLWTAGTVSLRQQIASQVITADVNLMTALHYVTTEGKVFSFKENPAVMIADLGRTDIVDLAADVETAYIVFSDGTYLSVSNRGH